MLIGLLTIILVIEPVITDEAKFRILQISGGRYVLPKVVTSADQPGNQTSPESGSSGQVTEQTEQGRQGFGNLLLGGSEMVVPVSTDFGIVIEKIGANAKVIKDVDPSNEQSYIQALAEGVAHAKGSAYPGEKGNTYLFSHSTDAPWNIIRYNAVFYLLNKLDIGDKVIIFYQGRRYDYVVYDKTIVSGSDTHFLSDSYQEPVLTLQTCDPPGTVLNRLVVRARLEANK